MRLAVLLLFAACEKQGPVESTPGASSSGGTATPTIRSIDAGVATIGTDAAPVAPPADAAVVAVRPDAAVRRPTPSRADRDVVMMDDEAAQRFADQLTYEAPRRRDDDMAKRRPGADLSGQIADVRDGGRQVVLGGGGAGRGTRGDGAARKGLASGPKIDSTEPTEVNGPLGRITISSKQAFDESTLQPDLVVAKISSVYMAGVKRCYKAHLEQDPAARGKITLRFTVNETGRALSAKATGFASAIDTCLDAQMSSWRFPIPKDKDGEVTQAGFEIGLQLVPE